MIKENQISNIVTENNEQRKHLYFGHVKLSAFMSPNSLRTDLILRANIKGLNSNKIIAVSLSGDEASDPVHVRDVVDEMYRNMDLAIMKMALTGESDDPAKEQL